MVVTSSPGCSLAKRAHLPCLPRVVTTTALIPAWWISSAWRRVIFWPRSTSTSPVFRMHHVVRAHPAHQALGEAQLLVDLVPAHAGQIVTFGARRRAWKTAPAPLSSVGGSPGRRRLVDLDQASASDWVLSFSKVARIWGASLKACLIAASFPRPTARMRTVAGQLAGAVNAYPDHIVGGPSQTPAQAPRLGIMLAENSFLPLVIQCETEVNAGRPH